MSNSRAKGLNSYEAVPSTQSHIPQDSNLKVIAKKTLISHMLKFSVLFQ